MRITAKEKDIWDKMSAASALLASVLVPVVLAIVGNWYSNAVKRSEVQLKYTELAMTILKEKPSAETEAMRRWAIQIIDRYSGVPMSEQAQNELFTGMLSIDFFSNADFSSSTFKSANFDKAAFKSSSFNAALFEGSSFNTARFEQADFRNSVFPAADFRGADLSTARIDATTKLPK